MWVRTWANRKEDLWGSRRGIQRSKWVLNENLLSITVVIIIRQESYILRMHLCLGRIDGALMRRPDKHPFFFFFFFYSFFNGWGNVAPNKPIPYISRPLLQCTDPRLHFSCLRCLDFHHGCSINDWECCKWFLLMFLNFTLIKVNLIEVRRTTHSILKWNLSRCSVKISLNLIVAVRHHN